MALSVIKKGQKLSVTKNGNVVDKIIVRVSWKSSVKMDFDLSSVALRDAPNFPFGKGVAEQHVCYFGQPNTPAMKSAGDDKGGASQNNEEIEIDFTRLPADATHVHAMLTLYHASTRHQSFDDCQSATLEVVDAATNEVLIETEATDFDKNSTSLLFAEFRREAKGFSVIAVNQPFAKEIGDFFTAYGFEVEE